MTHMFDFFYSCIIIVTLKNSYLEVEEDTYSYIMRFRYDPFQTVIPSSRGLTDLAEMKSQKENAYSSRFPRSRDENWKSYPHRI